MFHFGILSWGASAALLVSASTAFAQNLPPTSRTVFKCVVAGKTVYSDAPCLGAVKVDVEPTRGLNKLSGRELVGADVRREQHRESFAQAIRPLTGLDAKQLDTQGRRMKLARPVQEDCRRLDGEIPVAQREEGLAERSALADAKARLLRLRQRFRELGC